MNKTTDGQNDITPEKRHSGDCFLDMDDGWRLWRTICLRGTGFPIVLLESLATPDAVIAIDGFLDLEEAAETVGMSAAAYCRQQNLEAEGETRKAWRRLTRQIKKGRVPDSLPDDPELRALLQNFGEATAVRDAAREIAGRIFVSARDAASVRLKEICLMPKFREAIIWQNRKVLHDSIDVLARMAPDAPNKYRLKHERLAASYLQRYCAKNDSIGFFGPIGWALGSDQGPALNVQCGPGLVADRQTYFEYWPINTLSELISRSPNALPWLSPYLDHTVRVNGTTLQIPGKPPQQINPGAASLLAEIDGRTPARVIAARLVKNSQSGFQSQKQVFQTLETLMRAKIVLWDASVPVTPFAAKALNRTIRAIGDKATRDQALTALKNLEDGRAKITAAAGDPDRLDAALAELEDRFSRITRRSPRRYDGKTYASRTLVYEDCRRDLDVALGPQLLDPLAPPLGLIMRCAQWHLNTIGQRLIDYLSGEFDRLVAETGEDSIEYLRLYHFNPKVPDRCRAIVGDVSEETRQRWQTIISRLGLQKEFQVQAADIRDSIIEQFPVVANTWRDAGFQSPDVMIAADTIEDICQGRYLFVLGETHVGLNTSLQPCLALQHPDPAQITKEWAEFLGPPQIKQITGREHRGARAATDSLWPEDFHLAHHRARSWRKPDRILRVGDLVIEKSGGRLLIRDPLKDVTFPISDFLRNFTGTSLSKSFSLFPRDRHSPRRTIDRLVISRETWRVPFLDADFALEPDLESRFVAARRWARTLNIPRWVFVRVPFELKPVYVDFDSPVSVDLLAKLIRRGRKDTPKSTVTISEMLPNPHQCWLPDAEGNRYACELRMVAVAPR